MPSTADAAQRARAVSLPLCAAQNENESSSALVTVLRLGRIVRVILILMKLNATQAGLGKLKYRALESGVEAPVYKVLSLLQELSLRVDVETDRRHIAWICEVIGSNRLYTAVISGKAGGKSMDTETEAWLKSQYRVTAEAAAGKPAQLKRSSLAASVGPDDPQRGTYGIRGLTTEQEASLASILAHVESWSFDVFELHKASGGQPLVPLVMTIFHRHDFFDRFRVRPEKMASALCYLQAGYAAVPYHNRLHASDVTQTLYSLLLCDKVSEHVSDLHLFAAVLAAAVHGECAVRAPAIISARRSTRSAQRWQRVSFATEGAASHACAPCAQLAGAGQARTARARLASPPRAPHDCLLARPPCAQTLATPA